MKWVYKKINPSIDSFRSAQQRFEHTHFTWNLSMTSVWLPHSDDIMVEMTMERARLSSSTSRGSNKPCWVQQDGG